ncbi:hypothetical protein [Bradyrhizobium sp. SYSU BS000235]|uniref:hypothetical protein n=1 Tax=Bradyrhizobium sp. SYSU BS000235 TaxID=3411332 RepID=UPI003C7398ED
MYALFKDHKQIGSAFGTEKEVWEAALIDGLVTDVPIPDDEDRIISAGYHVAIVKDVDLSRGDGCHKPYASRR